MINLLERVLVGRLDDSRTLVEVAHLEQRVSPALLHTEHSLQGTFAELRVVYSSVDGVTKLSRPALCPAPVPHEALLVALRIGRIGKEMTVGLVFRRCRRTHLALRHQRCVVKEYHSRHSVGAVHQRCRTFHYLYGVNRLAIYFYAVFVAPLLSFLSDAVVDYEHSVISQAADDGF